MRRARRWPGLRHSANSEPDPEAHPSASELQAAPGHDMDVEHEPCRMTTTPPGTHATRNASSSGSVAHSSGVPRCLMCAGPLPSSRARYCKAACRQRGFRLRRARGARLAEALANTPVEIPSEHDPRLVDGRGTQRKRLAQLTSAQRAALVLERYPELRALPNCDWQRLSLRAAFSILFGESARHSAHLELAALAGVLASAGVSAVYALRTGAHGAAACSTSIQHRFGITTPQRDHPGRVGGLGPRHGPDADARRNALRSTPPR